MKVCWDALLGVCMHRSTLTRNKLVLHLLCVEVNATALYNGMAYFRSVELTAADREI
jgi:hypothetical protein